MKLLLENWRQFLNERRITNSRDDFTCPEEDKYGSVYYDVERSVSGLNPALYDTEELTKFREYDKENLRAVQRDDGSFEELKADIKENGIKEELIIFFGRNGNVYIGEGNHRHQIALELGIDKIPVRFVFWRNVSGNSSYSKVYKVDVSSEDGDQ